MNLHNNAQVRYAFQWLSPSINVPSKLMCVCVRVCAHTCVKVQALNIFSKKIQLGFFTDTFLCYMKVLVRSLYIVLK